MEKYIKRMINEHKELVNRIDKLIGYIYSEDSAKDDRVEYANKWIQLSAMQTYEKALYARLKSKGIYCSEGRYFEELINNKTDCDGSQHA